MGMCVFKNPEGLKCAVGGLIKNKFHDESLDNYFLTPKSNNFLTKAIEKSLGTKLTKETHKLLVDLQVVHDSNKPPSWPKLLRELAEIYGLATSYLEKLIKAKKSNG